MCESVCACWLIPLFLWRNSLGPTSRSHTHTHTQSKSLLLPLSSVKAVISNCGYFVTEKPTINKPQLLRQVFKIVNFLLILYRLYILYLHTEHRQCGYNLISLQTLTDVQCPRCCSVLTSVCWKSRFFFFCTFHQNV